MWISAYFGEKDLWISAYFDKKDLWISAIKYFSNKIKGRKIIFRPFNLYSLILNLITSYTYSCQLLICNPSSLTAQNASMNAVARRALVMRGMLWSMAPRRMR